MSAQLASDTDTVLETLARIESPVLHAQLPFVWERAVGSHVYGADGRAVLDWTSGVLTANAGHSPASVVQAIVDQAQRGLLHAYSFPTAVRARALDRLVEVTGFPHAVLLTTGAEAVELAVKIARTRQRRLGTAEPVVLSFTGAFHGRTLGAQLSGGLPAQRHWIPRCDGFVHLPFPAVGTSLAAEAVDAALAEQGVDPAAVACVLLEPYQGSTLQILDPGAAQALQAWCRRHDALLVVDEVQSGFGRTGRLFGYQHAHLEPDLVLCGKGISGSLPVSCVLYRDPALVDGFGCGEVNSTHAANPVALAATEANLRLFTDGELVRTAERTGRLLDTSLDKLTTRHPEVVTAVRSLGLVAGVDLVRGVAQEVVGTCLDRGLLLFAPLGPDRSLLKIAPPLTTTPAELRAGLTILDGVLGDLATTR